MGKEVTMITIDCDKLSILELMWYTKDFGYNTMYAVYYKDKQGGNFIFVDIYFVILEVSNDFKDGETVNLFVNHIIDTPYWQRTKIIMR